MVSSTLLSPVQMASGPALRFPLAIHVGLAISLLERISSGLLVSGENGSSKSEYSKFSGDIVPAVRSLEMERADKSVQETVEL